MGFWPIKMRFFTLPTTKKVTRYIIRKTSTFSLLLLCTRLYYKDKNILSRRPVEPLKDEERDNHLFPVADICSWRSVPNHFFNDINHLCLQNRWDILEVTSVGLDGKQRVLCKNVSFAQNSQILYSKLFEDTYNRNV